MAFAVAALVFVASGVSSDAARLWQTPPAVQPSSAITSAQSPIRKVVTLIQEMKVQVEKDADEDLAAYDKYKCWCETNEREKEAAIEEADKRMTALSTFLEEAAAKEGELKTEIAQLAQDIEEDQDALATATAVRAKEHDAFAAAEADMKESISLLKQAIEKLAAVQLLQHKPKSADVDGAIAALVQVRSNVKRFSPKFHDVMQRDLFDVLDSLQGVSKHEAASAFLGYGPSDPTEDQKSEEQRGMEAKPNDLVGAAAGAKSYNARSGSILGILAEMKDEFDRDLAAAQKAELLDLIEFQQLRAAKLAEIAAAKKQKKQKEAALADLQNKVANAKKDLQSLKEAKAADEAFLEELRKGCKTEDENYAARSKVRSEEIVALNETLKILTADDARDLFGKTIAFIQLEDGSLARARAEDRAADRAMQRIAKVARSHKNWALVSLAVRVRLDAFVKVKAMMDKMLADLQTQQKDEYEKWEVCKKDIDETEDAIKEGENTKEDLDEKHTQLTNVLATLADDIAKLKTDVADMEVSLKQAGEDRHEENRVFQESVTDQRATIEILQKALRRLEDFYSKKKAFVQRAEPGAAAPPPPPTPKDYEKSAGAGGVVQLLMKIIEEAQVAEQDLAMSEQKSQEDYAAIVRDTTASIEADRASIVEKEEQTAAANSEKAETEAAQESNNQELEKQTDLLRAYHLDCDYLLKYFDVRQKARAEEMDAITDAKAILSGADFGK